MKMDEDQSRRYTTDYRRSFEKSLERVRFKSNRRLQPPQAVTRFNAVQGIPIEETIQPFAREIHAAGVKS